MSNKKGWWFHESRRHSLARRGIKTKRTLRMAWDIDSAKSQGYKIEYMTPDEYIRRTRLDPQKNKSYFKKYYDIEKGEERELAELTKIIDDPNKKVEIPYVGDEPYMHEGRHRAMGAKEGGHELIPVAVSIPKEDRARLGEEFIKRAFPHSGEDYKDEWRERFAKGNPVAYMSGDSRKIYSDIVTEDIYNKEVEREKEFKRRKEIESLLDEVKKKNP